MTNWVVKNFKPGFDLDALYGQIPLSGSSDDSWRHMTLVFDNADDAVTDNDLLWEIQRYATDVGRTYILDEAYFNAVSLRKVINKYGYVSSETPDVKTIQMVSKSEILDYILGDVVVIVGTDLDSIQDYFDIDQNTDVKNVYVLNSGAPGGMIRSFLSTVRTTEYNLSASLTTE